MSGKFDEAEQYSKVNKRQTEDGIELIGRLAPKQGTKVLDVGCGTGNVTKVLAERVHPGRVVGIDIDADRIAIAKNRYAADNIEHCVAGAGDNMPGEDYDLVFSNYVLHWVPNNEAVFGPIASKLTAGGRFAFIVLDTITQKMIDDHLGWANDQFKQGFLCRLKGLSKNDVERLAKENNFDVEDLRTGTYALEFENVDEYIEGYLVHGGLSKNMFDAEKIREFYGSSKVTMSLPTTVAILKKK